MNKIIRLNESDLIRVVKRVLVEQNSTRTSTLFYESELGDIGGLSNSSQTSSTPKTPSKPIQSYTVQSEGYLLYDASGANEDRLKIFKGAIFNKVGDNTVVAKTTYQKVQSSGNIWCTKKGTVTYYCKTGKFMYKGDGGPCDNGGTPNYVDPNDNKGRYYDNGKYLTNQLKRVCDYKVAAPEQPTAKVDEAAKKCGWDDVENYKNSGWVCPKAVPMEWVNYPCVASHPNAKFIKLNDGKIRIKIGDYTYKANGYKVGSDKKEVKFTCQDQDFSNVTLLSNQTVTRPEESNNVDTKAFQDFVVSKNNWILAPMGADGKWGPRTTSAWRLYGKDYLASINNSTVTESDLTRIIQRVVSEEQTTNQPPTSKIVPTTPNKKTINPTIEIDCINRVIVSSQLPKLDMIANSKIINHYCNK